MKKLFENVKISIVSNNKIRVYHDNIMNFESDKNKLKNVDIFQDETWLIIKDSINKEDYLDYTFTTNEEIENAKRCLCEDYLTKKRKNFIIRGTLRRKMDMTRYFPISSTVIEYYDNQTEEYFEKY